MSWSMWRSLKTVERLSHYLANKDLMYVEVPMEIWGRTPLQEEPVTHVNFFSPTLLRYMLPRRGLCVEHVRLAAYLHPSGRQLLAARAVARLTQCPLGVTALGCAETERFLNLGL